VLDVHRSQGSTGLLPVAVLQLALRDFSVSVVPSVQFYARTAVAFAAAWAFLLCACLQVGKPAALAASTFLALPLLKQLCTVLGRPGGLLRRPDLRGARRRGEAAHRGGPSRGAQRAGSRARRRCLGARRPTGARPQPKAARGRAPGARRGGVGGAQRAGLAPRRRRPEVQEIADFILARLKGAAAP